MHLVLGEDERVGGWAEARIPHLFLDALGPFRGFGIADEAGELRGAALFHGWAPRFRTIEVSFALESPRWLSRRLIAGILAYPFDQLAVQRLGAATPAGRGAAPAHRFLQAFGFRREGLARLGFGPHGHAVIWGLTARDWMRSPFHPGAPRS
jgi:hypothetical protein